MAQLVEHDLAKVGAAGSSPVSCSIETQKDIRKDVFFVFTSPAGARGFEVSAPLRSAQSGRPRTSCAVSCSCLKPGNIVKSMLLGFRLRVKISVPFRYSREA